MEGPGCAQSIDWPRCNSPDCGSNSTNMLSSCWRTASTCCSSLAGKLLAKITSPPTSGTPAPPGPGPGSASSVESNNFRSAEQSSSFGLLQMTKASRQRYFPAAPGFQNWMITRINFSVVCIAVSKRGVALSRVLVIRIGRCCLSPAGTPMALSIAWLMQ